MSEAMPQSTAATDSDDEVVRRIAGEMAGTPLAPLSDQERAERDQPRLFQFLTFFTLAPGSKRNVTYQLPIGSMRPKQTGDCAMSKRSSKKSKRRSKALPALGFAGVSLSMASGACASTDEASANAPPTSQSQNHEIFLGEEELSDVSLATFYVFDRENAGPPPLA